MIVCLNILSCLIFGGETIIATKSLNTDVLSIDSNFLETRVLDLLSCFYFYIVADWCHKEGDKLPDTDNADVQIPSVCAKVQ